LIEITRGLPDPALADPPPIYVEAHNDLGATLSGAGEPEAALAEWRKVLQVDPDFMDSLANLGMTLTRLGRDQEALPVLERAVALEPEAPDVRLDLGRSALRLGRYPEALAALEAFVALAPDHPGRGDVEQVIAALRSPPAGSRGSAPPPAPAADSLRRR
jgi:tetratricopeptide (TPR) repeat protein